MSKRKAPIKIDDAEDELPALKDESVSDSETAEQGDQQEEATRSRKKRRARRLELKKEESKFKQYLSHVIFTTILFFLFTSGFILASVLMAFQVLPTIAIIIATVVTIIGTGIGLVLVHQYVKRFF
ncbi:MAG: hypothetical protein ACTSRW_13435 [Candidatus Helarchaeota archaeon]